MTTYEDRLKLRAAATDVADGIWSEAEAKADLAISFGRRVVPEREWRHVLREERGDAQWEEVKRWANEVERQVG